MKKKKWGKIKANPQVFIGLAMLAVLAAGLYYFSQEAADRRSVKVYFSRGGKLTPVARPLPPDQAPLDRAVAALLAGPTPAERARGIETLIPPGTRAETVKAAGETATIVFNRNLEAYGGGSARVEGMISQIVYTATEISGIKKVLIRMAGEKELILGGEGLAIDKALGRGDLGR